MRSGEVAIKVAATAVFVLLCALIPSWIAPAYTPYPDITTAIDPPHLETSYRPAEGFFRRAALFSENFVDNEIRGTAINPEDIAREELLVEEYSKRLSLIIDTLVIDQYPENTSDSYGTTFTTVYGDDGTYIRLLRYYRGWEGDWRNWLDIIVDIDTLDIYHIYMSSESLQNHDKYREGLPDLDSLLSFLAEYTGYRPFFTTRGTSGDEVRISSLFGPEETDIKCAYAIEGFNYYAAAPKRFDYKISCNSDTHLIQQSVENDAKS